MARRFFRVGLVPLFLCVFHSCPGLALAGGVVPSVDECGIRLVRLFLHGFLQKLQCLQGCGDVFPAFFYGTDKGKLFLVEADFCFQFFFVRFQLCLIVEESLLLFVFQDVRRFRVVFGLHLSTCGFCPVEKVLDGRAVFGEAFRAGQLFQDGFAFRLVAGEESGKLSLRQHGHASELFEAEPHGLHDDAGHLVVARQPVGIPLFHFPFGRAVFELFAGALHPQGEPGMVNDAVVAFKFHFAVRRVAFRDAEPGVLFDAGHPQRFAFRVDIVVFRDVRHAVQPRGFLVQSHGDTVQDDGLSRAGVAADEEEGGCFAAHGVA